MKVEIIRTGSRGWNVPRALGSKIDNDRSLGIQILGAFYGILETLFEILFKVTNVTQQPKMWFWVSAWRSMSFF